MQLENKQPTAGTFRACHVELNKCADNQSAAPSTGRDISGTPQCVFFLRESECSEYRPRSVPRFAEPCFLSRITMVSGAKDENHRSTDSAGLRSHREPKSYNGLRLQGKRQHSFRHFCENTQCTYENGTGLLRSSKVQL